MMPGEGGSNLYELKIQMLWRHQTPFMNQAYVVDELSTSTEQGAILMITNFLFFDGGLT